MGKLSETVVRLIAEFKITTVVGAEYSTAPHSRYGTAAHPQRYGFPAEITYHGLCVVPNNDIQ